MSRIPLATYRLQFNNHFRFADAVKILDYLQNLGVTDIYASPILSSRSGSSHGYDATDPTRLDPDLGSAEDFAQFQRELEERGMGLVLDVVPNHMAASSENPWWVDVLENGPTSPFASYFDIDWNPPSDTLRNRILLPILGKSFGEVLDSGEIQLVRNEGHFYLRYYESLFPLAAHSYRRILALGFSPSKLRELVDHPAACDEFEGILAGLSSLFDSTNILSGGAIAAERRPKFDTLRDRLRRLLQAEPRIASLVDQNVRAFCGTPGDPASFSQLERLLREQHYKLVYWQNTNETINYRRFFTITDLVGLRIEDPLVFEATHTYLLRGLTQKAFTGLRIDHIDGLRDPFSYLTKLQEWFSAAGGASSARGESSSQSRTFVIVEKILERNEQLSFEWPVSGSTGYDYLNLANCVFVNSANGPALERFYADFIGRTAEWPDLLYQKKKLVMSTLLNAEMRALGRALGELAGEDRYARELPRAELTDALIEITASLPVYRTYTRNLEVSDEARALIAAALSAARGRRPQLNPRALDFVSDVLLLANPAHVFPEQREARLAFVTRWQQFTGPIVAKGLEDTALYVYFPLLSLNEVGGDPRPSHAASASDFQMYLQERTAHWPHSLNASTTHDTKRSEDARMRINALSDIPDEWTTRVQEWAGYNLPHKLEVNGQLVPDRNEEYLLYQTLIGVWPPCPPHSSGREQLIARVQAYAVKATREAMVHTRWTRPNEAHENALAHFVAAILDPANNTFLQSFNAFHQEVARVGAKNSIAQTLLKIASPGIPDFYQGSELWDLRLVDPDNRTPVDFVFREKLLSDLRANFISPARAQLCVLLSNWQDARVKLYVIWKALAARAHNRALFESGEYIPLGVTGPRASEILAFARRYENSWAVGIIPRWRPFDSASALHNSESVSNAWRDTRVSLPQGAPAAWLDTLAGRSVSSRTNSLLVAEALSVLPAALLLHS